jgi:hypothetical protein
MNHSKTWYVDALCQPVLNVLSSCGTKVACESFGGNDGKQRCPEGISRQAGLSQIARAIGRGQKKRGKEPIFVIQKHDARGGAPAVGEDKEKADARRNPVGSEPNSAMTGRSLEENAKQEGAPS